MEYTIDYGTGIKETVVGTLEEAEKAADDGAAYTQCSIRIFDEDGTQVAIRQWWGTEFDPDLYEDGEDTDVITFGTFGYFDVWNEEYFG